MKAGSWHDAFHDEFEMKAGLHSAFELDACLHVFEVDAGFQDAFEVDAGLLGALGAWWGVKERKPNHLRFKRGWCESSVAVIMVRQPAGPVTNKQTNKQASKQTNKQTDI